MFAVEIYAAIRSFVFIKGNSRREAARVFGLSRETVLKMCRFSLPPGYTRTGPLAKGEHAGRHTTTIGERLVADTAVLRDLPAVASEPCEKRAARVSSTALVRYRGRELSQIC